MLVPWRRALGQVHGGSTMSSLSLVAVLRTNRHIVSLMTKIHVPFRVRLSGLDAGVPSKAVWCRRQRWSWTQWTRRYSANQSS